MMATTHIGALGIFLWTNIFYFSNDVFDFTVPSKCLPMYLRESDLHPNITKSGNVTETETKDGIVEDEEDQAKHQRKKRKMMDEAKGHDNSEVSEESDSNEDETTSNGDESFKQSVFDPVTLAKREPVDPTQIYSHVFGELVTLSGLPPSKWQQLSMLETVRKRNQPKRAVIASNPQAPFFLTVKTGTNPTLDTREASKSYHEAKQQQEQEALR